MASFRSRGSKRARESVPVASVTDQQGAAGNGTLDIQTHQTSPLGIPLFRGSRRQDGEEEAAAAAALLDIAVTSELQQKAFMPSTACEQLPPLCSSPAGSKQPPASSGEHAECIEAADVEDLNHNSGTKSELLQLCEKFQREYGHVSQDGSPTPILLTEVSERLNVPRRRLYDIINVLEAVEIVERTGKLAYQWKGMSHLPVLCRQLIAEEESGMGINEAVRKLANTGPLKSRKDHTRSLWGLSRRFVRMLLTHKGSIPLVAAASRLMKDDASASDNAGSTAQLTVERRLYDIGSILSSIGLIHKFYTRRYGGSCKSRQPAFSWKYDVGTLSSNVVDAAASAQQHQQPSSQRSAVDVPSQLPVSCKQAVGTEEQFRAVLPKPGSHSSLESGTDEVELPLGGVRGRARAAAAADDLPTAATKRRRTVRNARPHSANLGCRKASSQSLSEFNVSSPVKADGSRAAFTDATVPASSNILDLFQKVSTTPSATMPPYSTNSGASHGAAMALEVPQHAAAAAAMLPWTYYCPMPMPLMPPAAAAAMCAPALPNSAQASMMHYMQQYGGVAIAAPTPFPCGPAMAAPQLFVRGYAAAAAACPRGGTAMPHAVYAAAPMGLPSMLQPPPGFSASSKETCSSNVQ